MILKVVESLNSYNLITRVNCLEFEGLILVINIVKRLLLVDDIYSFVCWQFGMQLRLCDLHFWALTSTQLDQITETWCKLCNNKILQLSCKYMVPVVLFVWPFRLIKWSDSRLKVMGFPAFPLLANQKVYKQHSRMPESRWPFVSPSGTG